MISHEEAMSLWYRAAEAEIGIAIPTDDLVYLSQMLYNARRIEGNLELNNLSIIKAKEEIWICKIDSLRQL